MGPHQNETGRARERGREREEDATSHVQLRVVGLCVYQHK